MIIDKNYVLYRICSFLTIAGTFTKQKSDDAKLFAIKRAFPSWLRKIVFSPYNPIYAIYREKKIKKAVTAYALHPVCVDFIRYCFENEVNFDTRDFFPLEDDARIQ
jgi:hypothetical protein